MNVTAHPYAEWAAQQIVEAFGHDGAFKILIRDRDKIEIAWLRPDRGLAKRLLKEPGWEVLYRDKVSILFKQSASNQLSFR